MTADMSFITLILNASLVVQLVMLSLLVASVISWTMIFSKRNAMKQAYEEANRFEERFWSGIELNVLYKNLATRNQTPIGMAAIFEAGFKEYSRLASQPGRGADMALEGAQRSMRVALSREIESLEIHLPFLATVGSTSPYVGLFGTVWGIMNSFRALGQMQNVTVATVAPGIAEALIATAMGLFAAIPAVIAYNRYSSNVERLINRYDTFVEEFSSILNRQSHEEPQPEAEEA
ncbi:MAG: protein TolQ [Gammaproteobacteria bacterium]|nr:protein TolQ [Gammaproteobacteria bacterium]MDH5594685.1 protein TolQ [Gammaproteobacteria bacterium]MDH5613523.1 protein TolQ [Gammaproteobacteria bacterium]